MTWKSDESACFTQGMLWPVIESNSGNRNQLRKDFTGRMLGNSPSFQEGWRKRGRTWTGAVGGGAWWPQPRSMWGSVAEMLLLSEWWKSAFVPEAEGARMLVTTSGSTVPSKENSYREFWNSAFLWHKSLLSWSSQSHWHHYLTTLNCKSC